MDERDVMERLTELLTKANSTVLNLDIVEQLELYLEMESLSNRVGAEILGYQSNNPEFKDTINNIKELFSEMDITGDPCIYEDYTKALDSFKKAVEAKQARLAREQTKKQDITILVKLFKSLDLSKPLSEVYEKLDSEYYTFKELITDLDEYIYTKSENMFFQEMIAEDERKRFESELKDK